MSFAESSCAGPASGRGDRLHLRRFRGPGVLNHRIDRLHCPTVDRPSQQQRRHHEPVLDAHHAGPYCRGSLRDCFSRLVHHRERLCGRECRYLGSEPCGLYNVDLAWIWPRVRSASGSHQREHGEKFDASMGLCLLSRGIGLYRYLLTDETMLAYNQRPSNCFTGSQLLTNTLVSAPVYHIPCVPRARIFSAGGAGCGVPRRQDRPADLEYGRDAKGRKGEMGICDAAHAASQDKWPWRFGHHRIEVRWVRRILCLLSFLSRTCHQRAPVSWRRKRKGIFLGSTGLIAYFCVLDLGMCFL